jgi:hypothetical protein
MNCLTDLGGKKANGRNFLTDVNWKFSKPAFSAYATVLYNQWAGLGLQGSFGKIAGTDAWPKLREIAAGRYTRNLSFESTIAELLLSAEVHPVELLFPGRYTENCFSPYFILGAGYFGFNPVARHGNTVIRLAPLHTEGQGFKQFPDRKPYSLQQLNVAGGLGWNLEVNPFLKLAAEFVYRKLFTDYLDDVSRSYIDPQYFNENLPDNTASVARKLADRRPEVNPNLVTQPGEKRGNPDNKDAYFSILFKAGMVIGRERKGF